MAYLITTFDGVSLPILEAEQDDSPAEIESTLLDSIGGVFDYFGSRARLARRYVIQISGIYFGEQSFLVDEFGNRVIDEFGNYIVTGGSVNSLRTQLMALRAKTGVRGTLTRVRQDDDVAETVTARLLRVSHAKKRDEMARMARITCVFETSDPGWASGSATVTSGNLADGLFGDLSVPNGGDVDLRDAVLTVTRSAGTVTSVWVRNTIIDWTWTGSLGVGDVLTVDDGAHTVRKGSADAYSGFVRAGTHTAHSWLELPQGTNPIRVTVTGGDATVAVTHYNRFK